MKNLIAHKNQLKITHLTVKFNTFIKHGLIRKHAFYILKGTLNMIHALTLLDS